MLVQGWGFVPFRHAENLLSHECQRGMLEGPLLHWRNATFSRMVETYNANAEVESRVILSRRPQGPSPLAIIFKPILRGL